MLHSNNSNRSSTRSSNCSSSPSSSSHSRTKCTSYAAHGLMACEGALWHQNQATLSTQTQHRQQLPHSKVQAPADFALSGSCNRYVLSLTCN